MIPEVILTIASWYNTPGKMADGREFNPKAMTCASWDYPLGTRLKVWGVHGTPELGPIVVEVTDRGPAKRLYDKGRHLDLSPEAFRFLAPLSQGLVEVAILPLSIQQTPVKAK